MILFINDLFKTINLKKKYLRRLDELVDLVGYLSGFFVDFF